MDPWPSVARPRAFSFSTGFFSGGRRQVGGKPVAHGVCIRIPVHLRRGIDVHRLGADPLDLLVDQAKGL